MKPADGEGLFGDDGCGLAELLHLPLFGAESLDHPHPRQVFLEDRGHSPGVFLDFPPHSSEPAAHGHSDVHSRRNGRQAEQAQVPGYGDEQGRHGHKQREYVDGVYETERHEPADALHVGGGPGHQVSGLVPIVEAVAQGLQAGQEVVAKPVRHVLGDVLRQVGLAVVESSGGQAYQQKGGRQPHQNAGIAALQDSVYRDAQQSRNRQ